MKLEPGAFLASAQRILRDANNNPDDCASRAIIHASYYAVFHLVAKSLGLDPAIKGNAGHTEVANKVKKYMGADAVITAAKSDYETMRVARVDADYKIGPAIANGQAPLAVSRALRVFKAAGITPTLP